MATEIAAAYVAIVPSLRGAAKQITSHLAGVDTSKVGSELGKQLSGAMGKAMDFKSVGMKFQSIGKDISGVGSKLTNNITKPALAASGVVAGLVGALGFKRLVGIDTAQAQFRGLGFDVEKTMAQVDKGVTGTALSMAEGASIAVGILATGAVPVNELEASLKRVANVSMAYGVESEQAAYLLNNVLTKQKVTWGDLSQMQMNQIPVVTALAEHYGVTGDKIMKMAQDGKISIEDLNTVLDKKAGKAAEEYSKSWAGISANVKANIGRIGASVLEGVFPQAKEQLANFLDSLKSDEVKAKAEQIGKAIGDAFGKVVDWVKQAKQAWDDLDPAMQDAIVKFGLVAVAAGPFLSVVGKLTSGIGAIFLAAGSVSAAIGTVSGAIGIMKGAAIVATPAMSALAGVFTVATAPITLIIAAIAALVAGLIYFFTQTETGKKLWDKIWNGIKATWDTVSAAIKTGIDAFVAFIKPIFQSIGDAWAVVWDGIKAVAESVTNWYNTHLGPVFAAVGELISAVWDQVSARLDIVWAHIQLVWDLLLAGWELLWGWITAVWETVGPPLMAAMQAAWENAKVVVETVWGHVKVIFETVWNQIKTVFEFVWNQIKNVVETTLGVIKGIITVVTGLIKGDWSKVWEGIKQIASTVWNGIKTAVSNAINLVKGTITNVMSAIRGVWDNAWEGIKGIASTVWEGIKSTFSAGVSTMRDIFTRIGDAIMNPLKSAFNAIAGFWNSTVGQISFEVPNWVPGVGGKGWSAPKIPMLATGGTATAAGWSLVGEAGPELLHMPRGASVVPLGHPASAAAIGGGSDSGGSGPSVIIHQVNHNPVATPEVEQVRQALQTVGAMGVLGLV